MELLDTIVAGNEFNGDSMSREQVNLPALSDSNMRRIHWGLEVPFDGKCGDGKSGGALPIFSFLWPKITWHLLLRRGFCYLLTICDAKYVGRHLLVHSGLEG